MPALQARGELAGRISAEGGLAGRLSPSGSLSGALSATECLSGGLTSSGALTGALAAAGASEWPVYTGETEVLPRAHARSILPTAHRSMASDITVLEVPYWETGNDSGITVYIAQEV